MIPKMLSNATDGPEIPLEPLNILVQDSPVSSRHGALELTVLNNITDLIKFALDTHDPQRMNTADIYDPLTFPLASQSM